ncbi:Imm53 family immunity protein [Neobacillus massiliamazoniensis]|uniref:Imm53 family immunity protein n=1 Tax=Neobacillus massiliamazoniensis TaxID=1499688 RepID=UPI000B892E4B
MNIINWIQNWYSKQCDFDEWSGWQDINGISITTLDNPGWYVKIDLDETDLESKVFEEVNIERTEHDWVQCKVIFEDENEDENRRFIGAGGPTNLEELLEIFKNWAER